VPGPPRQGSWPRPRRWPMARSWQDPTLRRFRGCGRENRDGTVDRQAVSKTGWSSGRPGEVRKGGF